MSQPFRVSAPEKWLIQVLRSNIKVGWVSDSIAAELARAYCRDDRTVWESLAKIGLANLVRVHGDTTAAPAPTKPTKRKPSPGPEKGSRS